MTYVITEPCVGTKDASCTEVCPVDCIDSDDDAEMQFINPDECIDCGACVDVCPVDAIYADTDVPAQWASYVTRNASFFAPAFE